MSSLSSCKGSPSHDRISLLTDDSLPRDYSLVSIASAGSQQSDEYFKSRDHAEILLRKMQNYLENDQLCDVTLIAGINGKRWVFHWLALWGVILFPSDEAEWFNWTFEIAVGSNTKRHTQDKELAVAIFGISNNKAISVQSVSLCAMQDLIPHHSYRKENVFYDA